MKVILLLLAIAGAVDPAASSSREPHASGPSPAAPRVEWRDSRAVGSPSAGRLVRGVKLPRFGVGFVTWDPITKRSPSRAWRRYGTDDTVRRTLRVARAYARAHPKALPLAIGDLSRPRGGDFGAQYGIIGHASHQNGLDVDVYYPRLDRRLPPPTTPAQVDRRRAQWLVDAFLRAGANKVLVGPSLGLRGPPDVVVPVAGHDNHLHVRF